MVLNVMCYFFETWCIYYVVLILLCTVPDDRNYKIRRHLCFTLYLKQNRLLTAINSETFLQFVAFIFQHFTKIMNNFMNNTAVTNTQSTQLYKHRHNMDIN